MISHYKFCLIIPVLTTSRNIKYRQTNGEKMSTITIPKENFIRLPEVQRRTGYSKAWLYKLIGENKFPKQIKIGSRSIAFIESEVDSWIAKRIAESRGEIS